MKSTPYPMRRRRSSIRMTRLVLFISFIILLSRLVIAGLGAWHYQQAQNADPIAVEQVALDGESRQNN